MNDNRLRTPLKNVRGLGAARSGTHHFTVQRITAVALVPLALWFVWFALSLIHLDYAGAHALVARPFNAVLLIGTLVYHSLLGVQVVVEDYVHHHGLKIATMMLLTFAHVVVAALAIFAVLRIAFGGGA